MSDLGAFHGAELAYLFDITVRAAPELNAEQRALGQHHDRLLDVVRRHRRPQRRGQAYLAGVRDTGGHPQPDPWANGIHTVDAAAEHRYAFWQGLD